MTVPLPTVAHLGPFCYRITSDNEEWSLSDVDPAQNYGYTDHERGVIILHASTTDAMRRVVLLHELMHAAAFCAGQIDKRKRKEEDWVVMTAPMLLDALQRSPDVTRYLGLSAA